MFPTLVIATDHQQAEYVANWMSRHPSGPRWDGGFGACPPTEPTPLSQIAWTGFGSALVHVEQLAPDRIIIVDYLNWKPSVPGEIAMVWGQIQALQYVSGSQVVWW